MLNLKPLQALCFPLMLLMGSALAENLNEAVELRLGGVSLFAEPFQSPFEDREKIISVWRTDQYGPVFIKILEEFAGSYRVVEDFETGIEILQIPERMVLQDANRDGRPEVLLVYMNSNQLSGEEFYLLLDTQSGRIFSSKLSFALDGTPAEVSVNQNLTIQRPDLLSWLEQEMKTSRFVKDTRSLEIKAVHEWLKKNRLAEAILVRPVNLPMSSWACNESNTRKSPQTNTFLKHQNMVFIHWWKYGVVAKNVTARTCKLILVEGTMSYNTGLRLKKGILEILYLDKVSYTYNINTGWLKYTLQ